MINEARLVKRLQAKDNIAFQELMNEFGPRLLVAAKLLTGNILAAEELVTDTLTDVFFAIKRFRGKSGLFTWLYGILLNKFYSQLKRRKREVAIDDFLLQEIKTKDISGTDKNLSSLVQQYLPGLLGKISPDHREVILLKYFEDMKINEIARVIKVPAGTVKTRLHHAIFNLRKVIKGMNLLSSSDTY